MGANDLFRALADPTRRDILRLLRQRDMTAGEIGDRFALAASTLSGHFNVLKQAGLIVAERKGTTFVYSLNISAAEESVCALMDVFQIGHARKEREP
ncbi:MAG TPA: metalloregulator ArsR/SmtB family transcription factor [Vicinamibacterales bacterium]|nr:metalloregulator ArsR/SmtB family transcription factor [Vicinamibacterales bacterium]